MSSPSPSIRRSTAPPSVFSDRWLWARKKSSLYPTKRAVRADDRRLVMASRHGMIRTTLALGLALTLGAPLAASAQAGGGAGPAPAQQGGAPPAGAQGGGRGRDGPPPTPSAHRAMTMSTD